MCMRSRRCQMRKCRYARDCIAFITMGLAAVGSCAECTTKAWGQIQWTPAPGRSDVHTQPFAFRPPEEDDESVKISNTTSGRSSAPSPALPASHPLQNRQFLFNTNEPLPNFATHTKQTTSFFLFDANKCHFRTSNLAIHTKQIALSQITSLFLFDTNERSPITTHQSPITDFSTR